MQAAAAALTGPADEAAARYAECLFTAERLGLRWDQALLGIEAAILLGADHPALRTSIGVSRKILEELRAQPFLDLLDRVVAQPDAQQHSTKAPKSTGAAASLPKR